MLQYRSCRAAKKNWQERKRVKAMKKIVAFLTAVLILAGSVGATATADNSLCVHPYEKVSTTKEICTATTTHPLWVGNKPNGESILADCTVTYKWEETKTVCTHCRQVLSTETKTISETHSIHH